jgi:pimeloyl-ACP methyl ester carboxylesterase
MGSQDRGGQFVHANGIDIHYVEQGEGPPLVLLQGAFASTGPAWAGTPFSYRDHMDTLAQHFRVIAPDTRGSGATVHKEGTASVAVLADDVAALIDALGLDRPLVCGFSEGGCTATVLAITRPDAVRAVVNHAGYDTLNPHAPIFTMGRGLLGGSPEATAADPDAFRAAFTSAEPTRTLFERMQADIDDAQGEGAWRTYVTGIFPRFTNPPGWTFDDLGSVTAPTLVLVGDRDDFCSVEEGITVYRALPQAELCVLPNHPHMVSPAAVAASVEFLRRHAA